MKYSDIALALYNKLPEFYRKSDSRVEDTFPNEIPTVVASSPEYVVPKTEEYSSLQQDLDGGKYRAYISNVVGDPIYYEYKKNVSDLFNADNSFIYENSHIQSRLDDNGVITIITDRNRYCLELVSDDITGNFSLSFASQISKNRDYIEIVCGGETYWTLSTLRIGIHQNYIELSTFLPLIYQTDPNLRNRPIIDFLDIQPITLDTVHQFTIKCTAIKNGLKLMIMIDSKVYKCQLLRQSLNIERPCCLGTVHFTSIGDKLSSATLGISSICARNYPLFRYLLALCSGLSQVSVLSERMLTLIDPDTCPEEFFYFLCDSFGVKYSREVDIKYNRKFLSVLGELIKRQGTENAIKYLCESLTGKSVEISYSPVYNEDTGKYLFRNMYIELLVNTMEEAMGLSDTAFIVQTFIGSQVPYYVNPIVESSIAFSMTYQDDLSKAVLSRSFVELKPQEILD